MYPILGFSGQFGSGKDAVAALVADRLAPEGWTHLSFAAALKNEVSNIYVACDNGHIRPSFGYLLDSGELVVFDVVEQSRPRRADGTPAPLVPAAPLPCGECGSVSASRFSAYDRSPAIRRALQWHGTEVRREEDPDYWVKLGIEAATAVAASGRLVVFTDVRFPNEADAVRAVGGAVVRLNISPDIRDQRLLLRDGHLPPEGAAEHPSELALNGYPDFDLVVSNDGMIADTVEAVLDFVETARAA